MLTTDLTKVLGIEHPVVLAGMGQVSGGDLVAAVSNAGGLGVVGGALYTPAQLRSILQDVKVSSQQKHHDGMAYKLIHRYAVSIEDPNHSLRCRLADTSSWWECSKDECKSK